jgi:hypothetical protein
MHAIGWVNLIFSLNLVFTENQFILESAFERYAYMQGTLSRDAIMIVSRRHGRGGGRHG